MYFSEYVVATRTAAHADPLGFMRPAGVLQDKLFKQFTVLSNHPAYHGMLCLIWDVLDRRQGSRDKTFSRDFRRAEILWGILNALEGCTILNIRKYAELVDGKEAFNLPAIPRTHPIYARVAYGTLGHYTRPSISWGLIDGQADGLTDIGKRLACAVAARAGVAFDTWLEKWMAGKPFAATDLRALARHLHLEATPSRAEREIWIELIERWKTAHPHTVDLWRSPLPVEVLSDAATSAEERAAFMDGLPGRYPSLAAPMRAIGEFEALSGIVQFVFDLKLAGLQYQGAGFDTVSADVRRDIAHAAVARARESQAARDPRLDASTLFATIAALEPSYAQLEQAVIDHHVRHQQGKRVSPYLDGADLLVKDKVDRKELGDLLEALAATPLAESRVELLRFRSRRDWHFGRCRAYHDWAYGRPA